MLRHKEVLDRDEAEMVPRVKTTTTTRCNGRLISLRSSFEACSQITSSLNMRSILGWPARVVFVAPPPLVSVSASRRAARSSRVHGLHM